MENPSRPVTGYPAHNPNANGHPPPNAAYPYPAPPPSSQPYQYPPYYQMPPPPPNPRAAFLRTLLIIAVGITIIFGSILLIFWLVVRPRIPEFQLTALSVSNFTINQSQVTGNWDAQFQAINPNKKMSVAYDTVASYILYKSKFLSQTQMPPFQQGTRNSTELAAKFSVIGSYVDVKVANALNADRARGTVNFNVRLEAIAGFRYGGWRTRRRVVRVWCNDAPVNVSSSSGSGKLVGGAKNCRVVM